MYSIDELTEKVHLLKELIFQADALDTKINNLKDELKDELTERGVDELVGDDWKVTWKSVSSKRFDQSLFKSNHPDLFDQYRVVTESRRFNLN